MSLNERHLVLLLAIKYDLHTLWPVLVTGRSPHHQDVVKEVLRQAETQCHKRNRRLVWLDAVKPIFSVSLP